MSTIKSSDEHLTLNADGTSKDIKFQANGVEKASISSAGAFTSTTIDATKLTGTIPNFTSTGIDDNADATAITIDSSENVGIGTTTPASTLEVAKSDQTNGAILSITNRASTSGWDTDDTIGTINFRTDDASTSQPIRGQITSKVTETLSGGTFPSPSGMVFSVANGNTLSETLRLSSDGRGLSQFTAKAWVNFQGSGTVNIKDSHNVSSISDNSTGNYSLSLANNLGNNHGVMSGYSIMDGLVYGDANNVSDAASFRFRTVVGSSNALFDSDEVHCIIFGD